MAFLIRQFRAAGCGAVMQYPYGKGSPAVVLHGIQHPAASFRSRFPNIIVSGSSFLVAKSQFRSWSNLLWEKRSGGVNESSLGHYFDSENHRLSCPLANLSLPSSFVTIQLIENKKNLTAFLVKKPFPQTIETVTLIWPIARNEEFYLPS